VVSVDGHLIPFVFHDAPLHLDAVGPGKSKPPGRLRNDAGGQFRGRYGPGPGRDPSDRSRPPA
jgi:hypothetical protein